MAGDDESYTAYTRKPSKPLKSPPYSDRGEKRILLEDRFSEVNLTLNR
jgi:hypothetical protein